MTELEKQSSNLDPETEDIRQERGLEEKSLSSEERTQVMSQLQELFGDKTGDLPIRFLNVEELLNVEIRQNDPYYSIKGLLNDRFRLGKEEEIAENSFIDLVRKTNEWSKGGQLGDRWSSYASHVTDWLYSTQGPRYVDIELSRFAKIYREQARILKAQGLDDWQFEARRMALEQIFKTPRSVLVYDQAMKKAWGNDEEIGSLEFDPYSSDKREMGMLLREIKESGDDKITYFARHLDAYRRYLRLRLCSSDNTYRQYQVMLIFRRVKRDEFEHHSKRKDFADEVLGAVLIIPDREYNQEQIRQIEKLRQQGFKSALFPIFDARMNLRYPEDDEVSRFAKEKIGEIRSAFKDEKK